MDGILIEQPTTDDERQEAAILCTTSLKISLPTVLDKIDDRVANAYAAFPDRIYIVGADGKVAYKGQPGPAGFNVPEAIAALEVALAGEITAYGQQPRQSLGSGRGRGGRGARGQGSEQVLGELDTNEDGRISREEWTGEDAGFDRFDTDGDGFLSLSEVQTSFGRGGRGGRGRGQSPQAQFSGMDTDSDGKLSRQEFPGPALMFDTMDTNKDDFVTLDEMQAGQGGRGLGRGRGRGRGATLGQMDADGDLRISREEWQRQPEMFDRLDANSDGFLTQEEMRRGRGRGGRG
jgi:hypothetical protein